MQSPFLKSIAALSGTLASLPNPDKSVQHRHRPTILGPGRLIGANSSRAFLAIRNRFDTGCIDAAGNQIVPHDRCPPLTKCEVVFTRAPLITMAFDCDTQRRPGSQKGSLPIKGCLRRPAQFGGIKAKQHPVTHIGQQVSCTCRGTSCAARRGRGRPARSGCARRAGCRAACCRRRGGGARTGRARCAARGIPGFR